SRHDRRWWPNCGPKIGFVFLGCVCRDCGVNGLDHHDIGTKGRGADGVHPADRIVDLYRSGWTLVEIASSMDRSVREVIEVLRAKGISLKPEHLQEAEAHLNRERDLAFVFRRPPSGSS